MLKVGLSQFTMALSPLRVVTQSMARLSITTSTGRLSTIPAQHNIVPVRGMAFYKTGGSDELWKAMAGVSQQGKKRGRAKNTMKKKDLNRGQMLGWGKAKMAWPGLTTKTTSGVGTDTKINEIEPLEDSKYNTYMEELEETRKNTKYSRGGKRTQHPLDRGWTGAKPLGRKFGAPEAHNKDYTFENFDSVLLEFKTVFKMTGNLGRVRRNSVLMVTGNGQGAVGFTVSPGKYGNNMAALRKATNKAGLRLLYVDRYEDRTVYHDFFTQFGQTRIFVKQQPPGHGVVAHRAIRAICEMVGIHDLYAKVEGSIHMQHIVKAFVLGLLRQKTHQVLADEKKLHLVEMRAENDYFPKVVASPSDGVVRTAAEIGHNEILDFEMITFEGNVPAWKPGTKNPWEGTHAWDKHERSNWAYRSHDEVRTRMRIENGTEWGAVRSHLYEKYPECVERNWKEYVKMSKERKGAEDDD